MQDKLVITDSNRFEEVINSLEVSYKKIKDIIQNENKQAELINETEIWSGPCASSMYNKYRELNGNYELIDYSLDIYIRFLKKTLNDYKRIDEEISKNIENMETTLDVHG